MAWTTYDAKGRPIVVGGSTIVTRRVMMQSVTVNVVGAVSEFRWQDAVTSMQAWGVRLPTDWVVGTDVTLTCAAVQIATGGSPTAVLRSSIGVEDTDGTYSNTNVENSVNVDRTYTQNTVRAVTRTVPAANLAAGRHIAWKIQRLGGDAGDTINEVLWGRAVYMEYIAIVPGPVDDVPVWSQYKARAHRTAAQSIPNAAWTKVEFNVEDFDPESDYDAAASYQYVAPVTGYYQVESSVSLGFQANAVASFIPCIFVEGAERSRGTRLWKDATNAYLATSVSDIVYLVQGEALDIRIYQNSGVAISTEAGSGAAVHFGIHLLSI